MSVELISGNQILSVDAVLNESHSLESRITSYPVETGASIADHIFNLPEVITMECFTTNTPIVGENSSAQLNVPGQGSLQLSVLQIDTTVNPVQDALNALRKMRDDKLPVTLITNLQTYENMALKSLTIPVTPENSRPKKSAGTAAFGGSLRFTAVFERLKTVAVQTIELEEATQPRSGKSRDQGEGAVDTGKQAAVPVSKKTESALLKLVNTGQSAVGNALDFLNPQVGFTP